jgi:hypothetical protein
MPVRLNEFRPKGGDGFGVSQTIELGGPIYVTAPIAIDSLMRQTKVVIVSLGERLKNNVHSPIRFGVVLYGKTVVSESILCAIIHDSHDVPSQSRKSSCFNR